jgi:ABC-type sugar transport system substrate-binding protein
VKKFLWFSLIIAMLLATSVACTAQTVNQTASSEASNVKASESATEAVSATESASVTGTASLTESDDVVATKNYKIAFSNSSLTDSWRVYMRDLLLAEVAKQGVTLIETDAGGDSNKQNSDIEFLLQKKPDAIIIAPMMQDSVNPGIEMAYNAGIPVVLFDRGVSTKLYTHFVSYPDRECARVASEDMVAYLTQKNGSPKGNIVILDCMAGSGTQVRMEQGFDLVLPKYPDIKIISRQYCDWERGKAKSYMEDVLQKFPPGSIDGIISTDGSQMLGAHDAIVEAGRDKEGIKYTNTDGSNGVCRLLKEGYCVGLAQFPCLVGAKALDMAIMCLQGTDPKEQDIEYPTIKVDASNVDQYYRPDAPDSAWTM